MSCYLLRSVSTMSVLAICSSCTLYDHLVLDLFCVPAVMAWHFLIYMYLSMFCPVTGLPGDPMENITALSDSDTHDQEAHPGLDENPVASVPSSPSMATSSSCSLPSTCPANLVTTIGPRVQQSTPPLSDCSEASPSSWMASGCATPPLVTFTRGQLQRRVQDDLGKLWEAQQEIMVEMLAQAIVNLAKGAKEGSRRAAVLNALVGEASCYLIPNFEVGVALCPRWEEWMLALAGDVDRTAHMEEVMDQYDNENMEMDVASFMGFGSRKGHARRDSRDPPARHRAHPRSRSRSRREDDRPRLPRTARDDEECDEAGGSRLREADGKQGEIYKLHQDPYSTSQHSCIVCSQLQPLYMALSDGHGRCSRIGPSTNCGSP